MCCGKRTKTKKAVSFFRSILDPELSEIYLKKKFRQYTVEINQMFAIVHSAAQIRHATKHLPSFLCIQGVDYITVHSQIPKPRFFGQKVLQLEMHSFIPVC